MFISLSKQIADRQLDLIAVDEAKRVEKFFWNMGCRFFACIGSPACIGSGRVVVAHPVESARAAAAAVRASPHPLAIADGE